MGLRISSTNLNVARMARRDGYLMKTIAILTMIFLPANFVSVSPWDSDIIT